MAVVADLIAGGAPVDHINNLGWTALIEAVILGDGGVAHLATVKALMAGGADIEIGDDDGVTPLSHAQNHGFGAIAEALRVGG